MAVQAILRVQQAFSVIATLLLTAYLFPKQAVVKNLEEFDFIVVGAGSAGSVIADRLSECGDNSVLVIDAGGDPPIESMIPSLFRFLPHTKHDWNFTSMPDDYTTQAQAYNVFNLTCGRVLGGGSSVNYMFYVRGCHEDYDSWAQTVKDDTWSYRNVLPYYIKSERLEDATILNSPMSCFHGTKGFLGVTRENRTEAYKYLDAFKEAGYDILLDVNGKHSIGYTLPLYTIANGIRQTTGYTNLGLNKDRKNLHILKDTFVTEILFDKNNNAIGVKASTSDNRFITLLARKEVIISAGTINTPKLLMLSGIGPRQHLQSMNIKVISDLPVGMNFQNHVLTVVGFKMGKSLESRKPANPFQFPVPTVVGYTGFNKSQTCADCQIFNFLIPSDSEGAYQLCTFNYGFKESLCRILLEAGRGRNINYAVVYPLQPQSRGRVTLRSKNPYDPPVVDLQTLAEKSDLENFVECLYDYVQVINTTYFRSVGAEIVDFKINKCKRFQFASKEYWRCHAQYMLKNSHHYTGTCAMGSVVDSRLCVYNAKRLRVADASIVPIIIRGNTNAPAIMIGEKASDIIKEDHGLCN